MDEHLLKRLCDQSRPVSDSKKKVSGEYVVEGFDLPCPPLLDVGHLETYVRRDPEALHGFSETSEWKRLRITISVVWKQCLLLWPFAKVSFMLNYATALALHLSKWMFICEINTPDA
jgi:hypothetical protein